ncbi:MAG: hypothetical protein JWL81_443 [Verrucomicrobiales bacterium]|nr:hypothetical protein [Verrucomicrobiales bacterium]
MNFRAFPQTSRTLKALCFSPQPCLFIFPALIFLTACSEKSREIPVETTSIQIEKGPDGLVRSKGRPEPLTGEVLTFTHGTTKQSVEPYLEGKPHGIWTRYWSTGHVKREQRWDHGDQIHQRQWYEDGTLKEDMEMRQGIAFGQVRLYWPDGRIRRVALVGENLSPHGHVLEYNEDGSVIVDAIFHHGQFVSGLRKEDSLAQPATAQAH